jgi:cytochrome P450
MSTTVACKGRSVADEAEVLAKSAERDLFDLSLLRLLDPEVLANPYPLYRKLRECEPVHWDPYSHTWIVTSYAEVITVLTRYSAERTPTPEELAAMGLSEFGPFAEMLVKQMLFMDRPAHTRLRSLCSAAFTPRRIARLREAIQSIADKLIDRVMDKGEMDIIADFSNPLPAMVAAELLGFPVEDHRQLKAWSADFAELLGNFQHNPDRAAQVLSSMNDLKTYVYRELNEQRTKPRDGLLHALMTAETESGRLSDEEIVANAIVTMIGGQETTTNLIGNGMLTLFRSPAALAELRSHPQIIESAVEELLRYESPSQHTGRIAPVDNVLGGKLIRKGEAVMAVMAAANRDPARFVEPDRLDLHRSDNRHVAFGWAAHFCFGAPLARMEGQIAFNTLLRRLPNISLATTALKWRGNTGLRGLVALPVTF